MPQRYLRLVGLLLAVAGYWAPWLTHPVVALRLNGYELSEWVTYLPGVRAGTLPLSRLAFLLPLACLAMLCAVVGSRPPAHPALPPLDRPLPTPAPQRRGLSDALPALVPGWGWLMLVLGLVLAFVVLPPYPYVLRAFADQEYQAQFFVAGFVLLAVLALPYLPVELKDVAQLVLAVAALGLASFALAKVQPAAAAVLNAPWGVGLGFFAMALGFAVLVLAALGQLFGPRE